MKMEVGESFRDLEQIAQQRRLFFLSSSLVRLLGRQEKVDLSWRGIASGQIGGIVGDAYSATCLIRHTSSWRQSRSVAQSPLGQVGQRANATRHKEATRGSLPRAEELSHRSGKAASVAKVGTEISVA